MVQDKCTRGGRQREERGGGHVNDRDFCHQPHPSFLALVPPPMKEKQGVRGGKGGGWPNSDKRRGGCVEMVLTRGEGNQNPENLADVICDRPHMSKDASKEPLWLSFVWPILLLK